MSQVTIFCPHCLMQPIIFDWELDEKEELDCNYCGKTFPNKWREERKDEFCSTDTGHKEN